MARRRTPEDMRHEEEVYWNNVKEKTRKKEVVEAKEEIKEETKGDEKRGGAVPATKSLAPNKMSINKDKNLIKENAFGDDRNLIDHGTKDPHYQYSVSDAIHLLDWIRKKYLEPFSPSSTRIEDKGSFFTENTSDILLTEPYHQDHFEGSLAEDIAKITATGTFAGRSKWFDMPKTIITPILSPGHWRSATVTIDYNEMTGGLYKINISFDDPFGIGRFPKTLQETMSASIEKQVAKLITIQTGVKNPIIMVTVDEKEIDQQGRGVNGWDCGPILFSNIEDRVKYITNDDDEEIAYSIPVHVTPIPVHVTPIPFSI